jgi:hypothetical protein
MNVHAYGSDIGLDGTTLTVTATGRAGRGALGTDRRTVDVATLQALSLRLGNPATNGRLELVDERGKTVVHFRRKSNDEMTTLFAELVAIAPDGVDQVPTSDAPLFKGDEDAASTESWAKRKAVARLRVQEGGFGGSNWQLYPESIETHDGRFLLSHEVTATVSDEVKRQFAPAKMLALGVFGVTKKRGAIYITVEGESFHTFGTLTSKDDKSARKFAAEVNKLAKQQPAPAALGSAAGETLDAADQIRKLAALRDDGLITADEYEEKKRELLGL